MKRILLIPLFVFALLHAEENYELKLYESIIPSIFNERPIKVYLDKDMSRLLKDSSKFEIVQYCNSSVTLLIGKNFKNLFDECKGKPVFSTSYRSFKNNDNSIGAFYWRKGRPQIRFKSDALKRYNLILPSKLQRYR